MIPQRRRKVWVVDDSATEAAHAAACLESRYDVLVFEDGANALECLAREVPPPDILVLDWLMPGVTGINVCRFLRDNPSRSDYQRVAVLLLTVHHRTEQVVEGLSAGANDFLSKPYSGEELLARVGALVRSLELLERAERAEAALRRLITHTPDAILSLDAEHTVTFANAQAERAFGRPVDALVGKSLGEVLPVSIDLSNATGLQRDLVLMERTYAPSIGVLAEGDLLVLSLRDVTEQRRLDSRRLDLYSIIAHDLRSPLNALFLRNELMIMDATEHGTTDLAKGLEKSQKNIRGMVALINDFLDVASLDGAPLPSGREPIDLRDVVLECIDDFAQTAVAGNVRLSAGPLAHASVRADRRRLLQIFTNLISNAIKFTPEGGSVDVSLTADKTSATFAVVDSGRGIAEADIPLLFKRYSRPPSGNDIEGTGLGLMIVRDLVEALGGAVAVTSAPGKGSTFSVNIPLATGAGTLER